jgi:hypothetical protein
MRVRNHGFALAIVLVAVIGVFALAMQSAVMSRSAIIEARVLRERADSERAAASAATIVLLAMTGSDVAGAADLGASGGSTGGSGDSGGVGSGDEPSEPEIELPPIIRELLGAKADELANRAREETGGQNGSGGQPQRSADGGGITGRVSRGARQESERGLILPGGPIEVLLPQGASTELPVRCRVWLSDATGGLNINTASDEEIERYFLSRISDALAARSIIDELLDWRDTDEFVRPRGAERLIYESMGMSCRNGQLASREELLYLPSMTREIFESIRDDIALDSDGRVHVGTASREVLASVPGMTEDVVDAVLKLRAEGALTEEALEAALPLSAREAKDRLRVTSSSILRLRVEVRRGPGEEGFTYEGLAVAGERGVRALGLKPL